MNEHNSIELAITPPFSLSRSCDSGQCFRWQRIDDDAYFGVAGGRGVLVRQAGNSIVISPADSCDERFWRDYFDLDRDYASIECQVEQDPLLCKSVASASGIRLFRQEPFEALISFIISANNNIKRISGIVERLCALCGEHITDNGRDYYAFPEPSAIAALDPSELVGIGAGYRAPFIVKSAGVIANGYDLEALRCMSLDDARKALLTFPGVGPKVADCVLLFSLGHYDAFPIDVWIGRALKYIFFDGCDPTRAQTEAVIASLGPYSGIVQQYIFFYARSIGRNIPKK